MYSQKALQVLQSGAYGGNGRIMEYSLYDRLTLAAGTLEHVLFQRTPGAGVSLAQTNNERQGSIAQGQTMIVHAIKLQLIPSAARSLAEYQLIVDILRETTIRFGIANHENLGTWRISEFFGNAFLGTIGGAAAGDQAPAQFPGTGVKYLNQEEVLAALTTFRVTVRHHTAPDPALNGDLIDVALMGERITAN